MFDAAAAATLIEATVAMAREGRPLMLRVAPAEGAFAQWAHYPPDDAVDPVSRCRWFYHSHDPDERDADEHGHFHLFFERDHPGLASVTPLAQPADPLEGAAVVHIAAVAIDAAGLPTALFTVNRWVTDEHLLPAEVIAAQVAGFSLDEAPGDVMVNRWLTAFVRTFAPSIATLLRQRDEALPRSAAAYEDRALEVVSTMPIDLTQLV